MTTRTLANTMGWTSIVCSLLFWVLVIVRWVVPSFPLPDVSVNYFAAIWALAIVLAVVAAVKGSSRWALAALLPLLTFFLVILLVGG